MVNKQLLPLLILLGGAVVSLTVMATSDVVLVEKHWVGMCLLLLLIVIYYGKRTYFNKALGVVLLLGVLNLIAFTPEVTTYSFGVNSLLITVQGFSFVVLLVYLVLHRERVLQMVGLASSRGDDKQEPVMNWEKVDKLKSRFSERSTEELIKVVQAKGVYGEEAVEAAKLLLEERTK